MNFYTAVLLALLFIAVAIFKNREHLRREKAFKQAFEHFPIDTDELVTKVLPNQITSFDKAEINKTANSIIEQYQDSFKDSYFNEVKCQIISKKQIRLYKYHRKNYPEHFNTMLDLLNMSADEDIVIGFGKEIF